MYKVKYIDFGRNEFKKLHAIGCSFYCVVDSVSTYLDENIGEGEWDIISIKAIQGIINPDHECGDSEMSEINNEEFVTVVCDKCGDINKIPQSMKEFTCMKCHKRVVREDDGEEKI